MLINNPCKQSPWTRNIPCDLEHSVGLLAYWNPSGEEFLAWNIQDLAYSGGNVHLFTAAICHIYLQFRRLIQLKLPTHPLMYKGGKVTDLGFLCVGIMYTAHLYAKHIMLIVIGGKCVKQTNRSDFPFPVRIRDVSNNDWSLLGRIYYFSMKLIMMVTISNYLSLC